MTRWEDTPQEAMAESGKRAGEPAPTGRFWSFVVFGVKVVGCDLVLGNS